MHVLLTNQCVTPFDRQQLATNHSCDLILSARPTCSWNILIVHTSYAESLHTLRLPTPYRKPHDKNNMFFTCISSVFSEHLACVLWFHMHVPTVHVHYLQFIWRYHSHARYHENDTWNHVSTCGIKQNHKKLIGNACDNVRRSLFFTRDIHVAFLSVTSPHTPPPPYCMCSPMQTHIKCTKPTGMNQPLQSKKKIHTPHGPSKVSLPRLTTNATTNPHTLPVHSTESTQARVMAVFIHDSGFVMMPKWSHVL